MSSKKDKEKRRDARAAVFEIYEEMPQIRCKGLCHRTCGSIPVVNAELPIFKKALKGPLKETYPIPNHGNQDPNGNTVPGGLLICGDKDLTCPALDEKSLRCTVHESRPLICRLYGLVDNEKMKCTHGCIPERWVSDKEVGGWYKRLHEIDRGKE